MKPKVARSENWKRLPGHPPNLPGALWFSGPDTMVVFSGVERREKGPREFHLSVARRDGRPVSDEQIAMVREAFGMQHALEDNGSEADRAAVLARTGRPVRARHLYLAIVN